MKSIAPYTRVLEILLSSFSKGDSPPIIEQQLIKTLEIDRSFHGSLNTFHLNGSQNAHPIVLIAAAYGLDTLLEWLIDHDVDVYAKHLDQSVPLAAAGILSPMYKKSLQILLFEVIQQSTALADEGITSITLPSLHEGHFRCLSKLLQTIPADRKRTLLLVDEVVYHFNILSYAPEQFPLYSKIFTLVMSWLFSFLSSHAAAQQPAFTFATLRRWIVVFHHHITGHPTIPAQFPAEYMSCIHLFAASFLLLFAIEDLFALLLVGSPQECPAWIKQVVRDIVISHRPLSHHHHHHHHNTSDGDGDDPHNHHDSQIYTSIFQLIPLPTSATNTTEAPHPSSASDQVPHATQLCGVAILVVLLMAPQVNINHIQSTIATYIGSIQYLYTYTRVFPIPDVPPAPKGIVMMPNKPTIAQQNLPDSERSHDNPLQGGEDSPTDGDDEQSLAACHMLLILGKLIHYHQLIIHQHNYYIIDLKIFTQLITVLRQLSPHLFHPFFILEHELLYAAEYITYNRATFQYTFNHQDRLVSLELPIDYSQYVHESDACQPNRLKSSMYETYDHILLQAPPLLPDSRLRGYTIPMTPSKFHVHLYVQSHKERIDNTSEVEFALNCQYLNSICQMMLFPGVIDDEIQSHSAASDRDRHNEQQQVTYEDDNHEVIDFGNDPETLKFLALAKHHSRPEAVSMPNAIAVGIHAVLRDAAVWSAEALSKGDASGAYYATGYHHSTNVVANQQMIAAGTGTSDANANAISDDNHVENDNTVATNNSKMNQRNDDDDDTINNQHLSPTSAKPLITLHQFLTHLEAIYKSTILDLTTKLDLSYDLFDHYDIVTPRVNLSDTVLNVYHVRGCLILMLGSFRAHIHTPFHIRRLIACLCALNTALNGLTPNAAINTLVYLSEPRVFMLGTIHGGLYTKNLLLSLLKRFIEPSLFYPGTKYNLSAHYSSFPLGQWDDGRLDNFTLNIIPPDQQTPFILHPYGYYVVHSFIFQRIMESRSLISRLIPCVSDTTSFLREEFHTDLRAKRLLSFVGQYCFHNDGWSLYSLLYEHSIKRLDDFTIAQGLSKIYEDLPLNRVSREFIKQCTSLSHDSVRWMVHTLGLCMKYCNTFRYPPPKKFIESKKLCYNLLHLVLMAYVNYTPESEYDHDDRSYSYKTTIIGTSPPHKSSDYRIYARRGAVITPLHNHFLLSESQQSYDTLFSLVFTSMAVYITDAGHPISIDFNLLEWAYRDNWEGFNHMWSQFVANIDHLQRSSTTSTILWTSFHLSESKWYITHPISCFSSLPIARAYLELKYKYLSPHSYHTKIFSSQDIAGILRCVGRLCTERAFTSLFFHTLLMKIIQYFPFTHSLCTLLQQYCALVYHSEQVPIHDWPGFISMITMAVYAPKYPRIVYDFDEVTGYPVQMDHLLPGLKPVSKEALSPAHRTCVVATTNITDADPSNVNLDAGGGGGSGRGPLGALGEGDTTLDMKRSRTGPLSALVPEDKVPSTQLGEIIRSAVPAHTILSTVLQSCPLNEHIATLSSSSEKEHFMSAVAYYMVIAAVGGVVHPSIIAERQEVQEALHKQRQRKTGHTATATQPIRSAYVMPGSNMYPHYAAVIAEMNRRSGYNHTIIPSLLSVLDTLFGLLPSSMPLLATEEQCAHQISCLSLESPNATTTAAPTMVFTHTVLPLKLAVTWNNRDVFDYKQCIPQSASTTPSLSYPPLLEMLLRFHRSDNGDSSHADADGGGVQPTPTPQSPVQRDITLNPLSIGINRSSLRLLLKQLLPVVPHLFLLGATGGTAAISALVNNTQFAPQISSTLFSPHVMALVCGTDSHCHPSSSSSSLIGMLFDLLSISVPPLPPLFTLGHLNHHSTVVISPYRFSGRQNGTKGADRGHASGVNTPVPTPVDAKSDMGTADNTPSETENTPGVGESVETRSIDANGNVIITTTTTRVEQRIGADGQPTVKKITIIKRKMAPVAAVSPSVSSVSPSSAAISPSPPSQTTTPPVSTQASGEILSGAAPTGSTLQHPPTNTLDTGAGDTKITAKEGVSDEYSQSNELGDQPMRPDDGSTLLSTTRPPHATTMSPIDTEVTLNNTVISTATHMYCDLFDGYLGKLVQSTLLVPPVTDKERSVAVPLWVINAFFFYGYRVVLQWQHRPLIKGNAEQQQHQHQHQQQQQQQQQQEWLDPQSTVYSERCSAVINRHYASHLPALSQRSLPVRCFYPSVAVALYYHPNTDAMRGILFPHMMKKSTEDQLQYIITTQLSFIVQDALAFMNNGNTSHQPHSTAESLWAAVDGVCRSDKHPHVQNKSNHTSIGPGLLWYVVSHLYMPNTSDLIPLVTAFTSSPQSDILHPMNCNIHGESLIMYALLRQFPEDIVMLLLQLCEKTRMVQHRDHSGFSILDYLTYTGYSYFNKHIHSYIASIFAK